MSDLCRRALDALLPPGSLWSPSDGGGLDLLLEGVAGNAEALREMLSSLAVIRNPLLTPVLADLEREFGITPDDVLPEPTRRSRLAAAKSASAGNGTADFLQRQLRAAGFDVYVHINDPPVDPATVEGVGELVVNGDTYQHSYYRATTCDDIDAVSGNSTAVCAAPAGFAQVPIPYAMPGSLWHLVFFVGGPATRNEAGELTSVAKAWVSPGRRHDLIGMVTKYKPIHAWGVLCTDGGVTGVVVEDAAGSGQRGKLQARETEPGVWQLEITTTDESLGDELYVIDQGGSGLVCRVRAQVIGLDDDLNAVWAPVLTTAIVDAPPYVGLQDAGGGYGVIQLRADYLGDDIWQLTLN